MHGYKLVEPTRMSVMQAPEPLCFLSVDVNTRTEPRSQRACTTLTPRFSAIGKSKSATSGHPPPAPAPARRRDQGT